MTGTAAQPDPWLDAARDFRAPVLVLVLLAVTAGYADALTQLQWGVFVANQSGNVVRTGMGLAGAATGWPGALTSVLAFTAGGGASFALGRARSPVGPPATRLAAAGLAILGWLAVLAWVPAATDGSASAARLVAIGLLGAAMGVLASLVVRIGRVPVTTTYATGAVLRLGQGAVSSAVVAPSARAVARRALAVTAAMVLAYAGGGALGTLAWRSLAAPVRSGLLVVGLLAVAGLLRGSGIRGTPRR